jgi:hypothetical protein
MKKLALITDDLSSATDCGIQVARSGLSTLVLFGNTTNDFDVRTAEVADAGAWGFTIGSAFFEKTFVPNGSFEDNVIAVCNHLHEIQ